PHYAPTQLSPRFFFPCSGPHRDLHSFPTRRSSDLTNTPPPPTVTLPLPVTTTPPPLKFMSPRLRKVPLKVWVTVWPLTIVVTVLDRKSTRLNSSHVKISYAVFCLKKKKKNNEWHFK